MNELSLDDLIREVKKYNQNEEDLKLITKAYKFASFYHEGQKRESGEDYITHPLNVCYILSIMHADTDTLCAALLHDTLEDTKAKKEDIEREFNKYVADLVDGVTNIKDLNFTSAELKLANTRKIATSIKKDVRIIIIKLADRLHNMRTLSYKNIEKQKAKAQETMDIYVPFAYYIGAYRLKSELEDLAFMYLNPEEYNSISVQRINTQDKYLPTVEEMGYKIEQILKNKEIPYSIRIRTKNIYGIYRKIQQGKKLADIHDLLALKVIVDDIDNCYRTLGYVHSLYRPVNGKFRDYICSPKTNKYQSLHTTLYVDDRLVHTQIRTFDMDKIASFGLPAFWDIKKGNMRRIMQSELSDSQVFNSLIQMDLENPNNEQFMDLLKKEIFSDKVYVFTTSGQVVELPKGSTIIDYVYKVHPMDAKRLIDVKVNDESVGFNYILQTNDRIKTTFGKIEHDIESEWELYAQTSYARKLIKQDKTN